MDAYMHQHLALERRDRWIRAAAASTQASQAQRSEQPVQPPAGRSRARRVGRLPHLRIAR